MKHFLLSLLLLTSLQSYSQRIDKASYLRKGFYKSYEEFINNSPSITNDFTVTLLQKAKKDSTIIAAEYHLLSDSTKKLRHIWGFCDGNYSYVKFPQPFSNHFWRIEIAGTYSLFNYAYKDIVMFGPPLFSLATVATTSLMPKSFSMVIIDKAGGFIDLYKHSPSHFMKKILKSHSELLTPYNISLEKIEKDQGLKNNVEKRKIEKDNLLKEYLIKLNELE